MLMLVQIDDRSGEVLGQALEELVNMGAHNVQLISSLTKKGRPGALLLIDLDEKLEPQIAVYVAAELGAWGYHVLASDHRHFDVITRNRSMTVVCDGRQQTFLLPCKFFSRDGKLLRVKVERRDVEEVQRFVRMSDDMCSTETVRACLEQAVRRHPVQERLEVHL